MRMSGHLVAAASAAALLITAGAASAQEPIGKGITMYMQMGGTAGDGATLARQTGAAEAAAAFGVDLKSQFSGWAPETMINQFKEAVAAKPTCIEIMRKLNGPTRSRARLATKGIHSSCSPGSIKARQTLAGG